MHRDPWTDIYHLAERLARILDDIQPGGGTARRWIAALPDPDDRARVMASLALVAAIGHGLMALASSEPPRERKGGH